MRTYYEKLTVSCSFYYLIGKTRLLRRLIKDVMLLVFSHLRRYCVAIPQVNELLSYLQCVYFAEKLQILPL